ncbi:E3 SUMO-protein ligase RanBP2, partial [Geodia barretti]
MSTIQGGSDPDLATKLAEQQLSRCKDDVAAHIHLVNHYNSSGESEKALGHCLSQRERKLFTDSKEWLTCTLHVAEHHYAAVKGESVQDYDAQCRVLVAVLDHLSLLFHTSRASGSLMASVLLKYDKVLFAALQALKAQHPHVNPVHRVALRELCGQFYLLLASYMYWSHRFKVSFTASHAVKYAQVGNLCLLAALSFPPPNLDSVPLVGGMEQRRELEAWHTRSCGRLCVVSRQLLLVSRVKGDIYLGGLAKIIEGQGGKLAIIKTLFTENEDLRGVRVGFASSPITYNIRRSYIAAESEHLLASTPAIPLPSEAEALVCDKIYFLSNGQDLPALLWLCVCLRAMDVTTSVYQWLQNMFFGLRVDLPGSYINTTAPDTLSLPDVEAMLVLSIHTLQSVLTSAPSHPPSLPNSLLHTLPVTMTTEFQGSDLSKYCQWWSYVHQYISPSASGGSADVKRVISEGLGLVRGCRPLRLNLSQLTSLAKHFQQRAESVVEANESSDGRDRSGSSSLIEDMLWRSGHYWEIIVAILTEIERGSKIRRPQVPHEGGGGVVLVTSGEHSGVSLLNEAHMALGDAAAYRRDLAKALGLYSKVKTSLAAWNQAQIYLVMAQQGSSGEIGETSGELKKKAEKCLDLALSRLTATDKDLKEKIEEKQKELKKMMLEDEESRRDVAVSLTYDSSPETSLLVPRKSSTPAASGIRQSRLSPFSPDKKTSSPMDSLREEMKEKDALITSMNEQLKSLQAEVSALKLYVSPASGYLSPHLSRSYQHLSPQAMSGGVPHQMVTPSGVAMYPPHPSFSSSFRSPLLQSPMGMNVHQQQQMVYQASPQPQLTPLPPHLSPASNPGLSISGTGPQMFGAQQQLASGVSYRSGGIGASNLQAGGVVQPSGAVLSEQPIPTGQVAAGAGYRLGGTQVSYLQPGTNVFPPGGTTLGGHAGNRVLPLGGYVFNEQSIPGGGQAANGVGYTTGGVGASNLQPGGVLHPSDAEQLILAGQAVGVGYRPATMGHQLGLQSGGMLPPVGAPLGQQTGSRVPTPGGTVFGQQPMVTGNQMILPNQLSYQMQLLQRGAMNQQPPLQLVDVQHLTQQPRTPVLTSSEPTSPPSSPPLPTHPDPSTTGFVLKPGTFLPASPEHKSVKTSPPSPPTAQYSPPKSVTTLPPTAATSLPSSAPVTTKPGVGIFGSAVPTPATIGTSVPESSPFSSSLPFGGGGFQFSMRPPLTINVEPPSTAGVKSETLASLLQSSTPQTASADFPDSSLFSLSSGLLGSVATTATPVSLSFYAPPTTTAAATLSLGSLGTSIIGTTSSPTAVKTTDGSEAEKRSDHESLYDAMPDFKPIVSLPQLEEISTGEEDERVLFANRAKLYRYDSSASAWKERGIGEIKILEHKTSGKARVLMRRDQILKLCCNHFITPEMTLAQLQGNNQLAWYTACDFSDGEPKPEKLAIKFKQALVVAEFRRVFEMCVEKAKGHKEESGGDEVSSSPPASAEVSLREKFSAPVGSWECDTCLVQNEASAVKCMACATAKPGLETEAVAGDSGASAAAKFSGLKFGGDSKSGVSSFGGPVSFPGSLGTASGGFSMGSLSLGSMLNAKSANSGGSGAPSATASSSTGSSGRFMFSGSLFSAHSTSASDSGGFKCTFGASATSTAANSAATADKTKTTSTTSGTEGGGFNFSLPSTTEAKTDAAKTSDTIGKFSFSVPSTTSTAQPPLFGSSEGFNFSLPPVAPTSTESKTETVLSGSPTEQQEGVLKLEPRASPPPKSCTAGLHFASIFNTSSSKPFQFSLSLDAPNIPSPTEQQPSDDLNTSAHEPDIHFEPIVTLPEAVEISSGEENEEAVFAERAKLFRFDSGVDQWKERGVGEMKILVNRQAGKARVLMRRDQVLKICCNHVITRSMTLTAMPGSNKAWTWFTPGDFSEEAEKPENFAIRFKSPALASTFKKAFEEAVSSAGTASKTTAKVSSQKEEKGENVQQESGEDSKAAEASSSKALDFAARFAPAQDSWDCEECYITNRKEDMKCCACGKSKPGAPHQSSLPTPKLIPFASNSGAHVTQSQQGTSLFGARLQLTPRHFTRNESPDDEDDADDCSSSSCSPSPRLSPGRVSFKQAVEPREESEDDVVIISVELPSEEKVKFAESLLLPPSFFNYEALPACPGCRGCVDLLTGHYERASGSEGDGETRTGTQISAAKLPTTEESSENLKEAIEIRLTQAVTPEDDEQSSVQPHTPPTSPPPLSAADEREPVQPHTPPTSPPPLSAAEPKLEVHTMFGAPSTTPSASLSFADLAGSGAGFLDQREEGFKFSGVGQKLFTSRDEQDDPEVEVNVHFKPVVTLPESVKVKSWDDDAEVLFSQRTKLYRFDEEGKWKERGRGELKILRHQETGKVKLLMRRDQTLKICCNHGLTPDMIVTLLANDEKACTWFTNADYAEEVVSHEKLCAKFKNVKCREDFMSVFERFRCEATEGEGGGEEGEEE